MKLKSILFNEVQFSKAQCKVVEAIEPGVACTEISDLQPLNRNEPPPFMVLIPLMSTLTREEHPANIFDIYVAVTDSEPRPGIFVKAEQSENIRERSTVNGNLNDDISIEVTFLHSSNNAATEVAAEVSQEEILLNDVFVAPLNNPADHSGNTNLPFVNSTMTFLFSETDSYIGEDEYGLNE